MTPVRSRRQRNDTAGDRLRQTVTTRAIASWAYSAKKVPIGEIHDGHREWIRTRNPAPSNSGR
jgi:hypothetical protein